MKTSTTKRGKKTPDFKAFRDWLRTMEVEAPPTLHVNGHMFPSALLTVDFGTPLKATKLTPEQALELTSRMKAVGRELVANKDRDLNIRVSHDGANGIYWAHV